jgi:hypothetical protein
MTKLRVLVLSFLDFTDISNIMLGMTGKKSGEKEIYINFYGI